MTTFTIPGKPEEWRPVCGYEGRYEVSSFGNVRSLLRKVRRHDGHWQTHAGRVLRQTVGTHGYPTVALCNGAERGTTRTVHTLVAAAFLGPRPEGHEVRHKNGNRLDPRADNLAYGTGADNQADRIAHGTHCRGEKNAMAKLTALDVKHARSMRNSGAKFREIARHFNVSEATIHDLVAGRSWGWM